MLVVNFCIRIKFINIFLGLKYDELFQEMNQIYDSTSCLLAVHRGWKGGIHIQSCGHHMHYDCRSSYCETLRSQSRLVFKVEPALLFSCHKFENWFPLDILC